MRKPEHRWETKEHVAILDPDAAGGEAHDERFVLRFADGREGRAWLRLDRQQIDAVAASDPDVAHAVRCWLAARGRFAIDLCDESGRGIARGGFGIDELSETPGAEHPKRHVPARRLVTLAPSNAELVDALGAFDRVIACEDSTDEPPEAAERIRLGPDLGPDLERVAALDPDLVVSSLSVPGMERIVTGLRARGIPQVVLAPRSVKDVHDDLRRVGRCLGEPRRAQAVVDSMRQQARELREQRPDEPVRIYLEWWPRPMFCPGRESYADELIELAGGVNVFGHRSGASVRIEPHELLRADPELCFVSWCGVAEDKLDPGTLIEREGLASLPAARAGRVYPLDERFSGRPGPRMLEASRRMAAAIRRSGVRRGGA